MSLMSENKSYFCSSGFNLKISQMSLTIYDTFDIAICNAILAFVCFTQCKLFCSRFALTKG